MNASEIVDASSITNVFVQLGGGVPRHGRARAFWRDGDNHQAISIDEQKGVYFDHRDGKGGGLLDLIQLVLGCDRRTALRRLADFNGFPLDDRPFTAAERREYALRQAQAEQLARDVEDFATGLELFLQRRFDQAAAITEFQLNADIEPGALLLRCRQDLLLLREADLETLVRTYRGIPDAMRRRFVEDGRRDRANAEAVTAACVELIAMPRPPLGACA